jgi:transcriptional regulator with XRE-family HTH domain
VQEDSDQDLDYTRRLGERLRAARRGLGLSLEAVDRASNREFKDSALSSYERGDRTISVPRLRRLAELYGTTVDELLPGPGSLGRPPGGNPTIDLTEGQRRGSRLEGVDPARLAVIRLRDLASTAEELAGDAGRLALIARSLLAWVAAGTESANGIDLRWRGSGRS